jgi:hypothetical protein
MFVEKVILIWMLFSMTLGNFLLRKSLVKESFYQNALSSMFEVEPILCVFSRKKRNIILNVLDRTKINNSFGRSKSHCMVHNTRNERQKVFDAL